MVGPNTDRYTSLPSTTYIVAIPKCPSITERGNSLKRALSFTNYMYIETSVPDADVIFSSYSTSIIQMYNQ